jgi:chromate reductase
VSVLFYFFISAQRFFAEKIMEHQPIIAGSLRKASFSLQMAQSVMKLHPALDCELIPLDLIPMYNEDLETETPPAGWTLFRESIRSKDAVLFITPEYNRSVPAVLKNAIDVGSAPHGQNVFNRKPAAVISLSSGKMGAFGAHHHLRQSLVFLNMPTLQQPEAYIGESEQLFNRNGSFSSQATEDFLLRFMEAFRKWIYVNRVKF